MNGEWAKNLENAFGTSERIIAVSLDIRGFTPFSISIESVDVGLYIKKIYLKMLKDYFYDATFTKPMGDGLFIVIKYYENDLKKKVNSIVDRCISLNKEFINLVKDDPMIPFKTPTKIGIGITRGSSCCIHFNDIIIDYSGKILNHAARLMEKARPSGVICDHIIFYNILEPELRELFIEEEVCIRGISEREPIKILILKDEVIISEIDRRRMDEPLWEEHNREYTCAYLKSIGTDLFKIVLEKKPLNLDDLVINIRIPHMLIVEELACIQV